MDPIDWSGSTQFAPWLKKDTPKKVFSLKLAICQAEASKACSISLRGGEGANLRREIGTELASQLTAVMIGGSAITMIMAMMAMIPVIVRCREFI
jgi:hypothetical protein